MKAELSIELISYFAPNCPKRIVTPNCPRRIVRAELSAPNCPSPNCPGTVQPPSPEVNPLNFCCCYKSLKMHKISPKPVEDHKSKLPIFVWLRWQQIH